MNARRTSALAGLILGVAVLGVGGWWLAHQANLGVYVTRAIEFFRQAGPLAFFSAMAVLPMIGFPLSAFTLVAGPVFGPAMGVGNVILCTLAAVVVDVALSYWIAAHGLRPLVSRGVSRLGYTLPDIRPETAWKMILLVRIVPGPPFFLQSYLLGLARVPFGAYMVISTIVPAAYVSATILFGDAIMRGDRWAMAGAVAIFLVAGGVIHQLRRKHRPEPKPVRSGSSSR